jgi:hypothetical protein
MSSNKKLACAALALSAASFVPAASAITFEVGDSLSGTLNTTMTIGAGWRMQAQSPDLIGKANLNPDVCGGIAQSCQGVFKNQIQPARTLAQSPGQAYLNADDGNLNYDKHDMTQGVFKVTQDLNMSFGEYGVFAKWLYFYDWVNSDFTEYHPNMITPANRLSVRCPQSGCQNTTSFDESYGPGAVVRSERTDPETLRQIGADLQMFDYYVYGAFNLPFADEVPITFKVGSQTINWGESTALVINSVNQSNPVNANNLFRVGFDLSELFVPTGMAFFSFEPFESATVEAFYGYEWKPTEIPAPGSFFSFADLGTNNAIDYASISFGGPAEDPFICDQDGVPGGAVGTGAQNPGPFEYSNPQSGCASPQNNPLSGLTNTSLTIRRLKDRPARDDGQFGISFKYFADWLNNGTELAFYFMNYHSKLPYVSFYSTQASCARAEGNSGNDETQNALELIVNCPDLPFLNGTSAAAARASTSNAVPIDTVQFVLEYPEDLQMYGFSFNTTLGDFSLQGEIAYRPNSPLQVDTQDLTFHALGPMLSRCHNQAVACQGTTTGISTVTGTNFGDSDFTPYPGSGVTAYNDTFDLGIGAGVGSARAFPSFVGAYRGVAAGETPPESYIRGWEKFDVWQFNLGGTYVQGATDNVIGADQLIWLFEVGAQFVPDLPGTDVLQIESPGTHYHASAGADGSMTGNMQQDCAHTQDCNYGGYNPETGQLYNGCTQAMLTGATPNTLCGDGLRFNPHQEDADGYADDFSAGYVIVSLIRYESVLPGISLAPFTLWQHDVVGTSTDVAGQFVESRKDLAFALEIRYKESMSLTPGYFWSTGGGQYNLQRDRDQGFIYFKYLF